MGSACAWCDTILRGCGTSESRITHTICSGCLEELRSTLTSAGLRLREGVERPGEAVAR